MITYRLVALALLASATAAAAAAEFCRIPRLTRSAPAIVEVEEAGQRGCGMVILDGRYIKLEQAAVRRELDPISCASRLHCDQVARYWLDANDAQPYVVIYRAPATRG